MKKWSAGYHYDTRKQLEISNLAGILEELFDHAGIPAKSICHDVVEKMKNSIHNSLRNSMQLSKSQKSCEIKVSDFMSEQTFEILRDVPSTLLEFLAFYPKIKGAIPVIDKVCQKRYEIEQVFRLALDVGAVIKTKEDLVGILNSIDELLQKIIQLIESSTFDVLGWYYYEPERRVEICWITNYLLSLSMNLPYERLIYKVLTHELAHYYSHCGLDADDKDWDTENFGLADTYVKEGIAQYFTYEICKKENSKFGIFSRYTNRKVFEKLLERQSQPYRCFLDWVPNHGRRTEVVRSAMLKIREVDGSYQNFLNFLTEMARSYT